MRGLLQILISLILIPSVCIGASFEGGVIVTSGTICSSDVQAEGNKERRDTIGIEGGSCTLSVDASCEGGSSPFNGHATLTDDLWAYYSCDAADGDDSSENHDATPTGSPVSAPVTKNNGAVDFTTGNAYLDIGSPGAALTAWSVAAWVYMPSGRGWSGTTVFLSSTNYNSDYLAYFDLNGKPGTYSSSFHTHGTSVGTDAWHHVVWSQDTDATKYYVVVDGDWAGRIAANAGYRNLLPNHLGSGNGGSGGVKCYGDEIGIWSRALTQTEVEDLYNSGSGLFY